MLEGLNLHPLNISYRTSAGGGQGCTKSLRRYSPKPAPGKDMVNCHDSSRAYNMVAVEIKRSVEYQAQKPPTKVYAVPRYQSIIVWRKGSHLLTCLKKGS